MGFTELCIRRPVFATVLSLVLLLAGLMSFSRLTVREYPNIDQPQVSVQTDYPGASAEVVCVATAPDNAAITYLGSLVDGTDAAFKYALVTGAVTGGGLTVIANAPNPAGYALLKDCFAEKSISALGLFSAALLPTLVAVAVFWLIP